MKIIDIKLRPSTGEAYPVFADDRQAFPPHHVIELLQAMDKAAQRWVHTKAPTDHVIGVNTYVVSVPGQGIIPPVVVEGVTYYIDQWVTRWQENLCVYLAAYRVDRDRGEKPKRIIGPFLHYRH